MVTASFLKLSAVAGALGALMLGLPGLIEIVTGEVTATSLVIGLSVGPLVPLLPAVHLFQSLARADGPAGRPGAACAGGERAFLVNLIGIGLFGAAGYLLNVGLFFVDEPTLEDVLAGPTNLALLLSAVTFAAGSIAYGVFLARSRVFARPVAIGYTVLMPAFAVAAGLPESALTGLLHGLVGAVLVALAVQVWAAADRVVAGAQASAARTAQASACTPGGLAP